MPNNKPEEIQCALKMLDGLDQSDQQEYQALRKALPILAVKLKQAGETVSEDVLASYAAQGAEDIAARVKALSSSTKQNRMINYADIKEKLSADDAEDVNAFFDSPEGTFLLLCAKADLDEIKAHYNADLDLSEYGDVFLQSLINERRPDVINYLYEMGVDFGALFAADILNLTEIGCAELAEIIIDGNKEDHIFMEELYNLASFHNYVDILSIMHEMPIAGDFNRDTAMFNAAKGNALESLEYLHQNFSVKLSVGEHSALILAATDSAIDTMKYLLQHGESFDDVHDEDFAGIFANCDLEVLTYMANHTTVFTRSGDVFTEIRERLASLRDWQVIHTEVIKGGLPRYAHRYNPHYYHHDLVIELSEILRAEGVDNALDCACNAAALFGSKAHLMRYLDKWAEDPQHPLFMATNMIFIPVRGELNLKAWGDAVMQHGPKMAELVQFADVLDTPMRSKCGRSWSVNATRDAVAEHVYEGGAQYPEFAKLCLEVGWNEELFIKGAELIERYKREHGSIDAEKYNGDLPDITIDGALFDKPAYNFRKLKDGDLRGLALGELTDCCQHLGDNGVGCTVHGFLSSSGGFYVLADKKTDQIVAQSWAWRGQQDEIVFDSLESLGGHMDTAQWSGLLANLATEFKKHADVSAFLVGTEGDTPQDLSLPIARALALAQPRDYAGYRDSADEQYVVYKR
jgi:hypothetical protein